jgi:hypothetical protein
MNELTVVEVQKALEKAENKIEKQDVRIKQLKKALAKTKGLSLKRYRELARSKKTLAAAMSTIKTYNSNKFTATEANRLAAAIYYNNDEYTSVGQVFNVAHNKVNFQAKKQLGIDIYDGDFFPSGMNITERIFTLGYGDIYYSVLIGLNGK